MMKSRGRTRKQRRKQKTGLRFLFGILLAVAGLAAAILAVLFGLVIDLLQKRVTPRGLRKEAGK